MLTARTRPAARMLARLIVVVALVGVTLPAALAQGCTRQGNAVTCADGRRGVFTGDAIIWSDGTKSSATPHQSVIIGNRPSVQVGPGVFVGQGRGSVPLDNPNSPYKKQCAVLDAVSYCY